MHRFSKARFLAGSFIAVDDSFGSGLVELACRSARGRFLAALGGLLVDGLETGLDVEVALGPFFGLAGPLYGGFDVWHEAQYITRPRELLRL